MYNPACTELIDDGPASVGLMTLLFLRYIYICFSFFKYDHWRELTHALVNSPPAVGCDPRVGQLGGAGDECWFLVGSWEDSINSFVTLKPPIHYLRRQSHTVI